MEKKRAYNSVNFDVTNGGGHSSISAKQAGFSHIFITAAVSLAVLLVVGGWQIKRALYDDTTSYVATSETSGTEETDASIATSTLAFLDGTTPLGTAVLDGVVEKYFSLQEQGLYTPEVAAKTAEKMAEGLSAPLTYRTYKAEDVQTTADTSYARMLAYRGDLQVSLTPLLANTEPEYEIFASYVSTRDKKNLEKLEVAAENYRAAVNATARVVPPKDALPEHLGILNAMEEFAVTLDALSANADDPFASVVVLRSYNQAETKVLTSFASLAKYYREKRS